MDALTLGEGTAIGGAISVAQALLMLVASVVIGLVVSRLARRVATDRFTPSQAEVAARLTLWTVVGLGVASALREIGFDLSVLMGAAGLLTVAVGFASQTSASNLISGLFLLFERPFSIRDTIRVNGTTGEVVSIDLLSVRMRTFDNLLVRVPNETLLKSEITNLSHFPIRRFDLVLRIGFEDDLDAVKSWLLDLVDQDVRVLDEPAPVLHFLGFIEYGSELQLSVWAPREGFLDVRNTLPLAVRSLLRENGVEMPVPRRHLSWTGEPPRSR